MAAGRLEHIIVDRLVPLLLIVVLPLLVTIHILDVRQDERRRDQVREACHRGNEIRRDQKIVLDLLVQGSAVLSVGATDTNVRRYFSESVMTLRERRDNIKIIDCHEVIK